MPLVIKFYFTSSMLNVFRTLIHRSSGACDFSIVSPHRSCVLVSMRIGVSVWLGWGGIRVAGFSLLHGCVTVHLTWYFLFFSRSVPDKEIPLKLGQLFDHFVTMNHLITRTVYGTRNEMQLL